MEDEPPRDVRESLSELEQRLLELERELRSDAARDAGAARSRSPVPRPPSGGAATIAAERPVAERRAPAAPAQQATTAGAAAGTPGPGAPSAHGDPARQMGPLVDETRRKVDALRDTLDGLTGASDRLREIAQVVVEDHGRALVRLERATAQQVRAARADEAEWVAPPATEPAVAAAPAAATPPPTVPTAAPVEMPGTPAPAADTAAGAEPPTDKAEAPAVSERGPRRGRWLWGGLAALLAGAAVAAVVVIADRDEPQQTTPTVPGSMSRIALTPELGPDTSAFESVPGTRPASDAGAVNDLCDGLVGAAVVVRPSGGDEVPPCQGLVTVASGTLSALALAERSDGRKRSCVDAADVPSIAADRPNRRLTAGRETAVQRATTRAQRANEGSTLTPGERVGRVHTAAFEAGRAFDARNDLRLLAVRKAEGGTCVVPGRDDVASGRYPLANRIELLARQDSLDQLAVDRAAVAIGHLTSGPAPISATVLRSER
jgi:hypothetical protein